MALRRAHGASDPSDDQSTPTPHRKRARWSPRRIGAAAAAAGSVGAIIMALLPPAAATASPSPTGNGNGSTFPSCPTGTQTLVYSEDGDDENGTGANGDRHSSGEKLKVTVLSGSTATHIYVGTKPGQNEGNWKWNVYQGTWVGPSTLDNLHDGQNNEDIERYLVCGGATTPGPSPTKTKGSGTNLEVSCTTAGFSGSMLFSKVKPNHMNGSPIAYDITDTEGSGSVSQAQSLTVTINAGWTVTGVIVVAWPHDDDVPAYTYNKYSGPWVGPTVIAGLSAPQYKDGGQWKVSTIKYFGVCGYPTPSPSPSVSPSASPSPSPSASPSPSPSPSASPSPSPSPSASPSPSPSASPSPSPSPSASPSPSPSPSDSPSPSPSASPSPSPSDSPDPTPTPEPSDPPSPSPSTTVPDLPKTGSSLTGLLWSAVALVLGGAALMLFVSDRRAGRENPAA